MKALLHAKRIYFAPLDEKRFMSKENKGQSGLYVLICRTTDKFYIGSSEVLGNRLLDYTQPSYETCSYSYSKGDSQTRAGQLHLRGTRNLPSRPSFGTRAILVRST
jgi:hypothetical protein